MGDQTQVVMRPGWAWVRSEDGWREVHESDADESERERERGRVDQRRLAGDECGWI